MFQLFVNNGKFELSVMDVLHQERVCNTHTVVVKTSLSGFDSCSRA